MNKIIIIGNLGQDPEMRYSQNGQQRTTFSVASNRRYATGAGEQREETQWFSVTAWGRLAETCSQHLSKGHMVYVEGRVQTREYTGRDGEKRFSLDVNAADVQFLGQRRAEGSRPQGGEGDEAQGGQAQGGQAQGGQTQGDDAQGGAPDQAPEDGQGEGDLPPDIPFC